jgi:hypothetical protein
MFGISPNGYLQVVLVRSLKEIWSGAASTVRGSNKSPVMVERLFDAFLMIWPRQSKPMELSDRSVA